MFGRKRKVDDFSSEIESHLALEIERLQQEQGLTYEQAGSTARRAFGNVTKAEENFYESGRWLWLDHLRQDFRFAVRMLRKSLGFTTVAVLTLALGIGANTAIFSIVDAVLLKPLPYKNPGELTVIWETNPKHGDAHNVVSPANFLDWQAQNSVFQGMAYLGDSRVTLTGTGAPEQLDVQYVSANFFDLLGVKPILGHAFTPINGSPGNDSVVVLSYGFWQDKFGSDPLVIGKTIELNGTSATILGIAPKRFDVFIAEGSLTGEHPQLWEAFAFPPEYRDHAKAGRFLMVLGRLKRGVALARAQAQ